MRRVSLLLLGFFVLGVLGIVFAYVSPQHSWDAAERNIPAENAAAAATTSARVAEVIDGDTLRLMDGRRVRLLGIDADEKGRPCYAAAQDALADYVGERSITLQRDGRDTGQYGRQLRYVFADGTNVNVALVRDGAVEASLYDRDTRYRGALLRAEQAAREQQRGCEWGRDAVGAAQRVRACDASAYVGQRVSVTGIISDTHTDADSGTVFLNFGGTYPDHCFTAVIFRSDAHRFTSPAETYAGAPVTVTGTVETYQGTPQIILEKPRQILRQE